MDGQRFDALVKGLGRDATRRRLIGGLAGGAALLGAGVLAADDAGAATTRTKPSKKCSGKNRGRCDGKCVRLTNAKNCGTCGRACDSGERCSNGLVCQDKNCLEATNSEGNVVLAADGGLTLHSDLESQEYGAFSFKVPKKATLADISSIVIDYAFSDGSTCGATSPRIGIGFKNLPDDYLAVQIPPDACDTPDQSGVTVNLVGNNTPYVWTNYGANASHSSLTTYDEALQFFGDEKIGDLFLTLDSSNGQPQTVTLKACIEVGQNG